MSKGIIREQLYTITLTGDVKVTTRGYDVVEREDQTIIPDSAGKPVFMTDTANIKDMSSENMPFFS